MGTLLKIILVVLVAGLLALVGFAYYPGSLAPDQAPVSRPVTLNVD